MARRKQRFDLVNMINEITPKSIEFHLNCKDPATGQIEKCSFLGPNTNLDKRLANYDRETGSFSSVVTPAVNALDSLAMVHDVAYSSKDLAVRHQADQELMDGAIQLINDPATDSHTRRNAQIVKTIMQIKLKLGFGYRGGQLNPDINALVRDAQRASQDPSFSGSPSLATVIVPLLVLASSIGIPAVISLLKKKKK